MFDAPAAADVASWTLLLKLETRVLLPHGAGAKDEVAELCCCHLDVSAAAIYCCADVALTDADAVDAVKVKIRRRRHSLDVAFRIELQL